MDIKYRAPITTTEKPSLAIDATRLRKGSDPTAATSSPATNASPTSETVDTNATSELISVGRNEAMALHEETISRLADEIANGSYTPDLNIVAERVAEVLGV